MPRESRLFVKTSLVALLLAFAWGGWFAVAEAAGLAFDPMWPVEHAHLAFVGWLVNLVIGIALWMLPLDRARYPRTAGRYPPWLPYLTYALLNGGLVARIASEPYARISALAAAWLIASAIAQLAAVVLFAAVAWSRTRAPAHPAPGVR